MSRTSLLASCVTAALGFGCQTPSGGALNDGPAPRTVAAANPSPLVEVPADADPPPDRTRFGLMDVFELEWAADPQISPDGKRVVYLRNFMDIQNDGRRSTLWIVDTDGTNHRPLITDVPGVGKPRWSPDGTRLAYISKGEGGAQIFVRWMDTAQSTAITRVTESPSQLAWSPDGRKLAFIMRVPGEAKPLAKLPSAPEGAKWAKPPMMTDEVVYRSDGDGFLKPGYEHLFVVPAEGGTPRQITRGDLHYDGQPAWSPDSRHVYLSANLDPDWRYQPRESEIWRIEVATSTITRLTERSGPDGAPAVSPDGRTLAYLGFEDRYLGFQVRRIHLKDLATGAVTVLADDLDRTIRAIEWSPDGRGLYAAYDDHGNGKVAFVPRSGPRRIVAADLGGTSFGRPYGSGSFSVSGNGRIAYTLGRPEHPADVAVVGPRGDVRRLTRLNDDLLGHKALGAVEAFEVPSSFDGQKIQGWIVRPPGFDPSKKYPLILEIHGGPFANYGDRFSAECQLYAAAGYVVVYVNPRGSTSYGEDFANLIHHNYPNQDYDDLMSAVDHVIGLGFVDAKQLFVTGGSGGGVLTAWIVGKTQRFRAAVVAKPVINWFSFIFTSDSTAFFKRYWFSGYPWEKPDEYIKRSPLFLAGNVRTPTMLLSGEDDLRTPMSEAEQFYTALKLQKVDSVLVRIPGASHFIAARPSQLIAKVAYIMAWFDKYRPKPR